MTKFMSLAIEQQIFLFRKHRVMIDYDLSKLYGVSTKALIQAVKRNPLRFPSDFVFQLSKTEKTELVTNCDRFAPLKHSSKPPYAFTEQGVSMLSSVLKSDRAALMNVAIMRVFVKIREMLSTNKDLGRKLGEMEERYDAKFKVVFDAIRELMKPVRQAAMVRIKGFTRR